MRLPHEIKHKGFCAGRNSFRRQIDFHIDRNQSLRKAACFKQADVIIRIDLQAASANVKRLNVKIFQFGFKLLPSGGRERSTQFHKLCQVRGKYAFRASLRRRAPVSTPRIPQDNASAPFRPQAGRECIHQERAEHFRRRRLPMQKAGTDEQNAYLRISAAR